MQASAGEAYSYNDRTASAMTVYDTLDRKIYGQWMELM
jgi:hypothetical protein